MWACYAALMCLAIAVNLPPIYLTTFSAEFGRARPDRASGTAAAEASTPPGPGGAAAGLTREEMGRIPATLFIGLVLGIALSGPAADRFGGKAFVALGLALLAVGLLLMAAARSYVVLLASAFVMGLGAGVVDMVLSPIVCALEPDRKTAAMNWLHSFYCAGALLTTLVGWLAIHLGVPWRLFAAVGALAPAAVLVWFLTLRVPPMVADGNDREPLDRLLASGFFIVMLVLMGFTGAAEAGMGQWLPAYAERALKCSPETGAAALAAFLGAMWLGRVVAAMLGHRVNTWTLLFSSAALAAAGYLGAALLPWWPAALGACVATGFAVGNLWPTTLGLAANRIHHGGATMFGVLGAVGNSGCFLAPWLIGILGDLGGLRAAMGLAVIAPLAILVTLLLMRRDSHDPARSAPGSPAGTAPS